MNKIISLLLLLFLSSILNAQDLVYFTDAKTNKCGYKDKSGKIVIDAKYDYTKNFTRGGIAKVNIGGKYFQGNFGDGHWGYIDATGKEVIPIKYDAVGALPFGNDFSEGRVPVELDHKWGYVDSATGKELDSLKYDKAFAFKEGLGPVKLGDKEGRVDKSGREVIPVIYDEIQKFDSYKGIAAAKLNGKWGYIDKLGKQVIPFKYDRVSTYFIQGKSKVKLNNEEYFIDMTGKQLKD